MAAEVALPSLRQRIADRLVICRAALRTIATGAAIALVAPVSAAPNLAATNALILRHAAGGLTTACRDSGGHPGDMRAAITAADLTGDGLVEWFVNGAAYRCEGSNGDPGIFGNGGMPVDIESGQPNGLSRQVFGETVFGLKLERAGGRPIAWVAVGGLYCGQRTVEVRANAWSCEVPLRWNAAAKRLQFAPPNAARNVKRTD